MTKETKGNTAAPSAAQAILAAITSEANGAGKAQGLITEAIKAGNKAAFVAVATGLERMKDKAKRKAFFAILRTRMRRGAKVSEQPQQWTVKRGEDGIYAVVLKDWPSAGGDEAGKLRKALDLVKAHITDPAVSVELMTALQSNLPGVVKPQPEVTAQH